MLSRLTGADQLGNTTVPSPACTDNTEGASPAGHRPRTPIPRGSFTRQQAAGGPVICDESKRWPQGTKCPPNTMAQRCMQTTALHASAAHLAQASAQAFLTTQGCSGWQATSWHSQASRCQAPAWTLSPHPGRPSPCCPRCLPHRWLGLLLPTLCISAQGPGDAYTASEHL